jgi:hypothetical protein
VKRYAHVARFVPFESGYPVLTADVPAVPGPFRFGLARDPAEDHTMNTRTTQTVVRFGSVFWLPGFDASQPPGEYLVDRDEEPIEIASHLAWRHVATFIHLPAVSTASPMRQMVSIDPVLLDAALEQDQKQS